MDRAKWLKGINVILLILVLWQAVTGSVSDFTPERIFGVIHPLGGLLLVAFVAIHLFLNWGWVKSTYFKTVVKKWGTKRGDEASI